MLERETVTKQKAKATNTEIPKGVKEANELEAFLIPIKGPMGSYTERERERDRKRET